MTTGDDATRTVRGRGPRSRKERQLRRTYFVPDTQASSGIWRFLAVPITPKTIDGGKNHRNESHPLRQNRLLELTIYKQLVPDAVVRGWVFHPHTMLDLACAGARIRYFI